MGYLWQRRWDVARIGAEFYRIFAMSSFRHPAGPAVLTLALTLVAGMFVEAPVSHAVSRVESNCSRRASRAAVSLGGRWLRENLRCRFSELSEPGTGHCAALPSPEALAAQSRLFLRADRNCFSACSVSQEIQCVADSMCPPLPAVGSAERCTAGAKNRPFDIRSLEFPGPFCEEAIGGPILYPADLAACIDTLTINVTEAVVHALFGDVALGPPPNAAAMGCLSKISTRTRRLIRITHAKITNCRNAILRGKRTGNPARCAIEDLSAATVISTATKKLRATVLAQCDADEIGQLDLCGAGIGGIATPEQAVDCLIDLALEVSNPSTPPTLRRYVTASLIDASFPPAPSCGDGKTNQTPNAFLPLGEQCDGNDDSACPGNCLPPGSPFECTCANVPRIRYVAGAGTSDLDQGWTGIAHDTLLPEGGGFTMDLSDCDCSEMDGARCAGVSTDSVCTVSGAHKPRCSWEPSGPQSCDQRGDGNGIHENTDCYICDESSVNSGSPCKDSSDCVAQCYDDAEVAQGSCAAGQGDCASGEICRGRCDRSQTCGILPMSPPAPVASGGVAICIVQSLADDLSGTFDIVTGEHSMNQRTNVKVHLGVNNNVPCPVCGGVCEGGTFDGGICRGTCSGSAGACRFDDECPSGEFCSAASPDCHGGSCGLALVCHGGADDGQACRIQSSTELFGTISNDCRPSPTTNISGQGLAIDYLPITSELVSLPSALPCTAPGFELFDCPCPADGGQRTQPNACNPACNAGPALGLGCANGNDSTGEFTTCAGGFNAGRACDEDDDCPSSSCSNNPTHCVGDPVFERNACVLDSQCGTGTCEDACPLGRCVPLCLPDAGDPEDGTCSAGPTIYRCSGTLARFRSCNRAQAEGSCSATCSVSATPCTANPDCPVSESCNGDCELTRLCESGFDGVLGTSDDIVGAGICVADLPTCLPDPIRAEGGDIFNAAGSPNQPLSVSVFCIGRTNSIGINSVLGVGGPGRIRRQGTHVSSVFKSLP